MKTNKRQGISLIVLVITIIIMIILAAAIILSLESSGIIGKASDAKTKTNIAAEKEQISFAYNEALLNSEGDEVSKEDLQKELSRVVAGDESDRTKVVVGDNLVITYIVSGRKYIINDNGNIEGPLDAMSMAEEISNTMWEYNTTTTTGKVTLTKYIGESANVVVPAYYKVNGKAYPVEIGVSTNNKGPFNGTVLGYNKLKSVVIENGVTCQNKDASRMFINNQKLETVNKIPDGATKIDSTFYNCKALKAVPELPDSVIQFQYTFYHCTSITEITKIPAKTTILTNAFDGCTALKSVCDIPINVTSLKSAFANCTLLEGDIKCVSNKVTTMTDTFTGTVKDITFKVPAGSTTYTTCSKLELPENITLETYDMDIESEYINLTDMCGVVGKELNVYFDNIVYSEEDYTVNVVCAYGQQSDGKWSYTPTTAGEFDITIQLLDGTNVVTSKTSSVNIFNEPTSTGSIKYLAIGSSTTAAGVYTQRLLDNFSNTNYSITLLGTLGTAPNLYEGRGGWSFATYHDAKYGDIINPFYSSETKGFNMSYYMNNNSYSGVDYVTIGLGINGLFGCKSNITALQYIDTMMKDLNDMIDSIHEYNENIKIGVLVTIPPTSDENKFYNDYGDTQTLERYRLNNIIWCNKLITEFPEKNNVYLVPVNASIDRVNGFYNGVHPNDTGYNQMGDTIYSWILSTL